MSDSLAYNVLFFIQSIPEAIPSHTTKSATPSTYPTSPNRRHLLDSTRLFPSERDGIIVDAARLWQKSGTEGGSERDDIRVESFIERDLVINPSGDQNNMFDMEAASLVPATSTTMATVSDGAASAEEEEAADRFETVKLMKKIDTDRIPCPRLSGATFGPGVGGLAIFHNGDIRKVWSWWDTKNPSKRSFITNNKFSGISEVLPGAATKSTTKASAFPRSLKELNEMTKAAREAQWGGTEDGASSALAHFEGDSFFEEDSASSSDSGDEQNEDFLNSEAKDSKDLYTQYFGQYQQPTLAVSVYGPPLEQEDAAGGGALPDGTPSDMLAPFVKITLEYDPLVLSRQSVMLAKGWKLGDITVKKSNGKASTLAWQSRSQLQQGKCRKDSFCNSWQAHLTYYIASSGPAQL